MRKANNKFRSNNTIYSLNYKFDSASPAGKCSGTALELIKKYNELAKEAHSNGNYVEMEVFRQYAEHYRKIVTEINERKNLQRDTQSEQPSATESEEAPKENADQPVVESEPVSVENAESPKENGQEKEEKKTRRRSFTVVEVATATTEPQTEPAAEKVPAKPRTRRVLNRKSPESNTPQEAVAE